MHIAILPFDGFNELDSLIALGILCRVRKPDWPVTLACPTPTVTSMNGVTVHAQASLAEACAADAIIIGSGIETRTIANNKSLMQQLKFDPSRQLIGAQCSGTLLLAKLGLLGETPACTDLITKPWVQEAGVELRCPSRRKRGVRSPSLAKHRPLSAREPSRRPEPGNLISGRSRINYKIASRLIRLNRKQSLHEKLRFPIS